MTDLERTDTAPVPTVDASADHLNLLWKLARLTQNTEMVPARLRNRPDAALAVMVYGHELGLRPMTSLREIFIVDGSPSCSAKLMRALIFKAGHRLEFREKTRDRVVLYGERGDGQASALITWEIEDAKLAGLLAKEVWKKYPRSMLTARATSEIARDIFPDVTVGYTPEELSRVDLSGDLDYIDVDEGDIPPDDDRPVDRDDRDVVELLDEAEQLALVDEDDA